MAKHLVVLIFSIIFVIIRAAKDCGKLSNGRIDDKGTKLPWAVQLREKSSNDIVCTGTLISNQHALFAAYCLWPKPYFVALKDNANIYVTVGNENVELQDIKIHPEWKFNRENYDADIAVVTFFNPIKVSNVVQPICLPEHAPGVIVANNGIVAGMNTIEESELRDRVSLEKNEVCFKNFPKRIQNISPRTFCANWTGDDLEVANGFSGSYFYDLSDSWYIQGIESESFVLKNECQVRKHSVFTNVAHYIDWIQTIIKKDAAKNYKDIELACNFVKNYEGLYGCEAENVIIDSPNVRIASIGGNPSQGKTNNDVQYVWIKNSKTTYLPNFEAGIFFPNLLKYLVTGSGVKSVQRDNFAGMPKVESVDLSGNEIQEIPEDALLDNSELVDFFVNNNNLKKLPENLLANAPNFQRFMAANNSLESLEANFFKKTPILKIVSLENNRLQKINVDFSQFGNLKKIDLTNNACIDTYYNDWRHHKSAAIVQSEIQASCK